MATLESWRGARGTMGRLRSINIDNGTVSNPSLRKRAQKRSWMAMVHACSTNVADFNYVALKKRPETIGKALLDDPVEAHSMKYVRKRCTAEAGTTA